MRPGSGGWLGSGGVHAAPRPPPLLPPPPLLLPAPAPLLLGFSSLPVPHLKHELFEAKTLAPQFGHFQSPSRPAFRVCSPRPVDANDGSATGPLGPSASRSSFLRCSSDVSGLASPVKRSSLEPGAADGTAAALELDAPAALLLGIIFSTSASRFALNESGNSAPFSSSAARNFGSSGCLRASSMMNSASVLSETPR